MKSLLKRSPGTDREREHTNISTQSSAFLTIPGHCICAFPMSFRHIARHFLLVRGDNPKTQPGG